MNNSKSQSNTNNSADLADIVPPLEWINAHIPNAKRVDFSDYSMSKYEFPPNVKEYIQQTWTRINDINGGEYQKPDEPSTTTSKTVENNPLTNKTRKTLVDWTVEEKRVRALRFDCSAYWKKKYGVHIHPDETERFDWFKDHANKKYVLAAIPHLKVINEIIVPHEERTRFQSPLKIEK